MTEAVAATKKAKISAPLMFNTREIGKLISKKPRRMAQLYEFFPTLSSKPKRRVGGAPKQHDYIYASQWPYIFNRPDIYMSSQWKKAEKEKDIDALLSIVEEISPEYFKKPRCAGCNIVIKGKNVWDKDMEHVWDASRDITTGKTMVDRLSENNPLQSLKDNPSMLGLFGPMNKMPMCKLCNQGPNYKLKTNSPPRIQNIRPHIRGGPVLDPVENRSQIEDILKNVYWNMLYGPGKPDYDRAYYFPEDNEHLQYLQSLFAQESILRQFR